MKIYFFCADICNMSRSSWALSKHYKYIFWLSIQKETWIKLIKELLWFVASISYTKGYFGTVMMLNFHAFEYSSGIAPSKVKKKNPNDLKLAHDMEWCHVPFAYQIGPGLIWSGLRSFQSYLQKIRSRKRDTFQFIYTKNVLWK